MLPYIDVFKFNILKLSNNGTPRNRYVFCMDIDNFLSGSTKIPSPKLQISHEISYINNLLDGHSLNKQSTQRNTKCSKLAKAQGLLVLKIVNIQI